MTNDILLYAGGGVIFLWGAAHVGATRGVVAGFDEQKALLEAEGVAADERGTIDLEKYQWRPAENVSP